MNGADSCSKFLNWYRKVYKGVVYGGFWSNLGTIGYGNRGKRLTAKSHPTPFFVVSLYSITVVMCLYCKSINTKALFKANIVLESSRLGINPS